MTNKVVAIRTTPKTGGSKREGNALRHGAYRQLSGLDGRTREARSLFHLESTLVTSLGGAPSPQQILLIKRICVKSLRCTCLEVEILTRCGEVAKSVQNDYLRWSRELRLDLQALGMDRRAKEFIDLKAYIDERSDQR